MYCGLVKILFIVQMAITADNFNTRSSSKKPRTKDRDGRQFFEEDDFGSNRHSFYNKKPVVSCSDEKVSQKDEKEKKIIEDLSVAKAKYLSALISLEKKLYFIDEATKAEYNYLLIEKYQYDLKKQEANIRTIQLENKGDVNTNREMFNVKEDTFINILSNANTITNDVRDEEFLEDSLDTKFEIVQKRLEKEIVNFNLKFKNIKTLKQKFCDIYKLLEIYQNARNYLIWSTSKTEAEIFKDKLKCAELNLKTAKKEICVISVLCDFKNKFYVDYCILKNTFGTAENVNLEEYTTKILGLAKKVLKNLPVSIFDLDIHDNLLEIAREECFIANQKLGIDRDENLLIKKMWKVIKKTQILIYIYDWIYLFQKDLQVINNTVMEYEKMQKIICCHFKCKLHRQEDYAKTICNNKLN